MSAFIFFLILGSVGFAALVTGFKQRGTTLAAVRMVGFLAVVAAGIIIFAMSTIWVGSREIGIVTSFGKYDRTASPGFQFVKPWSNVDRFDTRIKTTTLTDVVVTLSPETPEAPGPTAKVDGRVRWHIATASETRDGKSSAAAENLWYKYKTLDKVTKDLVGPEAQTAMREALGENTSKPAKAGKNLRTIGTAIQTALSKVVTDDGVVIDSVNVTDVDLPDYIERAQQQSTEAEGKLATDRVEKQRATVKAQTDKERQRTVTRESLTADCHDLVRAAIQAGQALPATWNCSAYLGTAGAAPPIIVGAR